MLVIKSVSSVLSALKALMDSEAPPSLVRDNTRVAPNGDLYVVPMRSSPFNPTELLESFVEELKDAFQGIANILGELKF